MRSFAHFDVYTIEEGCQALRGYEGKARLNAGGSDLLTVLRGDYLPAYPEAVINLKTIPDLDYIREEGGFLRIGALATLGAMVRSPLLNARYQLLAEAARVVGTPQIRNVATLGGNLCQDIRCWYYRYPRNIGGPMPCLRKGEGSCWAVKGDNRYHAIIGGKRCFAVCPSDLAVALTALEGRVVISSTRGERSVPVPDFYSPMGSCLATDEIVREIEVPALKFPLRQTFRKFTLRKPIDFAIVSIATSLLVEDRVCRYARIALGAVAPFPVRTESAEKLLTNETLSLDIARLAAQEAVRDAKPLSKNGYKIQVVRTLLEREIASAGTDSPSERGGHSFA